MPFNVSGVFQRLFNWRNDRDAGIKILAERMDQELDGIADGLNDVVAGNVAWRGPMNVVLGTAGVPAFSFSDDPDTGMYRASAGVLGFTVDGTELIRLSDAEITFKGHKVWHADNDGPGSGLAADTADNADKVDGIHASSFLRSDANDTATGQITFNQGISTTGQDVYLSNGAIVASDTDGAFADRTSSNIDHLWHDDAADAWHFVSDGAYKSTGNSRLYAGGAQIQHSTDGNFLITATDSVANAAFTAARIDHNISGSDALTASRSHVGLAIDMDSSATGGDTVNEHRLYGLISDVDLTGDSDLAYSVLATVRAAQSMSQVSTIRGVYGLSEGDNSGGTVGTVEGGYFLGQANPTGSGSVTTTHGSNSKALIQSGDVTTANGVYAEVEIDAGSIGTAYGVNSHIDRDGGTITNGFLFYGSYATTAGITNPWGLYISGATKNHLSGTLTVADHIYSNGQYYYGDGKEIIDFGDSYLRLNQNGDFTSGIYTPGALRADGGLQVDGSRGLNSPTGSYGTVQTTGTPLGSYSGYSIAGQAVFMGNGTHFGLYDDINNDWLIRCAHNGGVELRYQGNIRLSSTSSGLTLHSNSSILGLPYFSRASDEVARFGYDSGSTNRNTFLSFYRGGTARRGYLQALSDGIQLVNDSGAVLRLYGSNDVRINGNTIWHTGNDGSGSGLAADTVDGIHAASFIRSDADDNVSGHTEWQDNKEVRVGNGADGRWFHNGSHTYFRNLTGNWYIQNQSHGGDVYFQAEDSVGTNRNMIILQDGSYVRLYCNGGEKARTDGSGLTVYGRLHADDAMYVGKNGGGDSWTYFYDDNSNTWRSFGWDDSQNAFVAEENDGGVHKLALVETSTNHAHTNFPIGTVLAVYTQGRQKNRNSSESIRLRTGNNSHYQIDDVDNYKGATLSGTWLLCGQHSDFNWANARRVL